MAEKLYFDLWYEKVFSYQRFLWFYSTSHNAHFPYGKPPLGLPATTKDFKEIVKL